MSREIAHYPVWKKSLAHARTINQLSELLDYYYDGTRRAARKKNRAAEIEAGEAAIRAERKLGQLIIAAGKAGALAKAGRKKIGVKKPQLTLQSAVVDKNLDKRARAVGR